MITEKQILELIKSAETWRIEKTISTDNTDKFCQAICAFANDLPNSRLNGYLLIGVKDNGELNGLNVTDKLMKDISAIRSAGNIIPFPTMTVTPFHFMKGDVLVVEVTPSLFPPVRYRGRTYVRIGPRKDFATIEEERMLSERVNSNYPTFDSMPCIGATLNDIDVKLFETEYLPKAIVEDEDIVDNRTIKEKMSALRLYDMRFDCPTNAAVILFGFNPKRFLFGNYIQFVRFSGKDKASDIVNEYEFQGGLVKMLPSLEAFIETSIIQKRPIPISLLREKTVLNYPIWAIRELMMNAIMHRDYQSNTPTKLYQFNDRLDIINAGGLYGNANASNFPDVNDYRNPVIAEAMKILGYVNKYNRGIARVNSELEENGNGKAQFNVDKITVFEVTVKDVLEIEKQILYNKDNSGLSNLSNQDGNQDNSLINNELNDLSNQDGNQDNENFIGDKLISNKGQSFKTNGIAVKDNKIVFFSKCSEELVEESKHILSLTYFPKTKNEIFKKLGISKQTKNSKKYLIPLINFGLLDTTVKYKTTSPNQKYYTTSLGKEFIEYLEEQKKLNSV